MFFNLDYCRCLSIEQIDVQLDCQAEYMSVDRSQEDREYYGKAYVNLQQAKEEKLMFIKNATLKYSKIYSIDSK